MKYIPHVVLVVLVALIISVVVSNRPKYPPYAVLCTSDGAYAVTGKHGRLEVEKETYQLAIEYLEFSKRWDETYDPTAEQKRRRAFENKDWKLCNQ